MGEVTAPVAAPTQVAAAPYLNAKETQRLTDLLPGPFPRLATASPDEVKAMDKLLSDAEVQVIRGAVDRDGDAAQVLEDAADKWVQALLEFGCDDGQSLLGAEHGVVDVLGPRGWHVGRLVPASLTPLG